MHLVDTPASGSPAHLVELVAGVEAPQIHRPAPGRGRAPGRRAGQRIAAGPALGLAAGVCRAGTGQSGGRLCAAGHQLQAGCAVFRADLGRRLAAAAELALRPDITGQAGRIATTRLAHYARPLRLSYGGPVLRVKGTQLNPEREMIQAGAELIGSDGVAAVTEVLLLAVEALQSAGLETLSVDVTLPSFVGALAAGPWPVAADKIEAVHALLDGKDVAGLRAAGASHYEPLIAASGPAEAALAALRALHLGAAFEARLADVADVVAALPADVRVTLDPTERHGFGFQSWIGFAIYAPGVRGEVGRGGAYAITHPDGHRETAVGFSLYVDALVDAGLGLSAARRILLPVGTSRADAAKLRAAGWSTVAALTDDADPHAFRCTHRWNGVEAVAIK